MKILAIVKDGKNNTQLRKLVAKGHEVVIITGKDIVPYQGVDVVVSLEDETTEDAFNIAQTYNIPFYAHIDWLPPWMVFNQSEYEWGHIDKISYRKKMNFVRKYQNLAMYWTMADVKSMSAECFHPLMREFIGIKDLQIYTRHPQVNAKEILKHKSPFTASQVTIISRFIPHKRVHHVLKALQMVEYNGIVNLIGSGEEKPLYEAIKGDLDIRFVSDLDKYKTISESEAVICPWNGTVPAESMLLGTPVIAYDSPYMREIYGDSIHYVTNNAISELARKIKEVILAEKKVNFIIEEDDILEKLIKKAVRK